ncbi:MAG: hypothetical protein E7262_05095 [Lachnospiraceae bacterium]|nr:hypothetical protein [Lachnospiraceae bacterium]
MDIISQYITITIIAVVFNIVLTVYMLVDARNKKSVIGIVLALLNLIYPIIMFIIYLIAVKLRVYILEHFQKDN